jgi:hypothetical protein
MTTSKHKIRELSERAFVLALDRGEVCQSGEAAFVHGFVAAFAFIDEEMAAFRRHVAEVEQLATRALACSSTPVVFSFNRVEQHVVKARLPQPGGAQDESDSNE